MIVASACKLAQHEFLTFKVVKIPRKQATGSRAVACAKPPKNKVYLASTSALAVSNMRLLLFSNFEILPNLNLRVEHLALFFQFGLKACASTQQA